MRLAIYSAAYFVCWMVCTSLYVGLVGAVTGNRVNLIPGLLISACVALLVVLIGWWLEVRLDLETRWRARYLPGVSRNIQMMQTVMSYPGLNALVTELTKHPDEFKTTSELAEAIGRDDKAVFDGLTYLNEWGLVYCGTTVSSDRRWRLQVPQWLQLLDEYQAWSSSQEGRVGLTSS